MVHEPMLPELLSVVGCDDYKRVLERATAFELGEQDANLVVEVRDGAVVGIVELPNVLR